MNENANSNATAAINATPALAAYATARAAADAAAKAAADAAAKLDAAADAVAAGGRTLRKDLNGREGLFAGCWTRGISYHYADARPMSVSVMRAEIAAWDAKHTAAECRLADWIAAKKMGAAAAGKGCGKGKGTRDGGMVSRFRPDGEAALEKRRAAAAKAAADAAAARGDAAAAVDAMFALSGLAPDATARAAAIEGELARRAAVAGGADAAAAAAAAKAAADAYRAAHSPADATPAA